MTGNDIMNAALSYVERGKCVFPCGMDKRPLVKGGFKSASKVQEQVIDWWRRWPQAMIGMPTGHVNGFMAVDCDGDEGISNFLRLCEEDDISPATSWQITPGGGRHYFFDMPDADIRCSASQLAKSVDVRASGGYIICAPSQRKDGKRYELRENAGISPLPEPLLARLLGLKNKNKDEPHIGNFFSPAEEAYARKALESEAAKVRKATEGERNDLLNSAAYALGQLVGAKLLDKPTVENELLAAAQVCGLHAKEAAKTIESGLNSGIVQPRKVYLRNIPPRIGQTSINVAEWPMPVHFAAFNLPRLDCAMLPGILGEYCAALSEEKQTPLELAACMSLVTLATAAQCRFVVKIRPGYCEPLNLYAICPLESANRKSAIVAACSEPLLSWENEQAEKLAPEIKRLKSERQTIERAIEGKRAKAVKARDMDSLRQLQSEIEDFEEHIPNNPIIPRLLADNTTPEALAALMEQMDGCISIISGEGGIFDILAGMYSQGIPNLDLFLKGHCGEAFRVDRRMAPPILLNRPLITLGISPQPVTLTDRSASKIFRRRGLDGRFLYFMPESILGRRKLEPIPMSEAVKDRFHAKIKMLLPAGPDKKRDEPIAIEFNGEAYKKWLEFTGWVEKELAPGGIFDGMNDWGGKLSGAVARISGLFHLALYDNAWETRIDGSTMDMAANMGKFLTEHARAAYALMGADEKIEAAKRVLAWIRRIAKNTFSVRDCYQALKQQTLFTHVQGVKDALLELEERYFIRELPTLYMGVGRKPATVYEVNPAALK